MIAAKGCKKACLSGQNMTIHSSLCLRVIVHDPVTLYRDCLMRVLNAYFGHTVKILGEAQTLADVRKILIHEHADLLIGVPYGVGETLLDWEVFGCQLKCYHPSLICLMWTNLPKNFVRLFTPAERVGKTLFLKKGVSIPVFCQVVSQVAAGDLSKNDVCRCPPEDDGTALKTLTLRESLVLSEMMEGKSLRQIAARYHNSLKTISSHKCSAMKKLGVSSNAQLLALLHALY